MSFVKVAEKDELSPGTMKGAKANSTHVLLVNLDGSYYAIGNICKHMQCELSGGTLKGEVITCPCHGSQYNVKTGAVVRGPTKAPEPAYEVKVEGEQVLVKA